MKILFLHGLGQSKKAWNQTIKQLNCEDVKCLDVISNKLDNPSFNYLADQLEMKLIEEQNPIIICGLSLGAVLGFELYFRHPEKYQG
ncbi:TPA: alpha/beta hydrolase [Streptococcus pyogenes]|nr:alpha/beta hydrolase [Streptococcus pyogenes]